MEFGKVDLLEGIDFHLPPDHPWCADILQPASVAHRKRWQIGLTGWGEPHWRGNIYPPSCPSSQFLDMYSRSYTCVELNSSFYHIPPAERIRQWVGKVPDSFLFFPKVWQGISHDRHASLDLIPVFQEAMACFGQHLGACFMQLPPGTGVTDLSRLTRLLSHWDPKQALFLEIRNPDLLQNAILLELLRDLRVGLVLTDVPGRRDLVHMCLTRSAFLLRFVATQDDEIDRRRIRDWHIRLAEWWTMGLAEATVFCHTADNRYAPDLSRLWLEEGKIIQNPLNFVQTPLDYRTNHQTSLFE